MIFTTWALRIPNQVGSEYLLLTGPLVIQKSLEGRTFLVFLDRPFCDVFVRFYFCAHSVLLKMSLNYISILLIPNAFSFVL